MAAAMGFAWMFSIHFPEVSFFGLCAGLVGALVAYKIIREAKAAFGMVAARSFLQDCLLDHHSGFPRHQRRIWESS